MSTFPAFNRDRGSQQADAVATPQPLNDRGSYPCPICHHGQLQGLVLTEAFSCSFCHHIFAADFKAQSVRVEDIHQPLTWRWFGRNWQIVRSPSEALTLSVWLVAIAVIILPPSIIWLSAHTLPPPSDRGTEFSTVWASLTFILHVGIVGWVLAEHYQLPLYLSAKLNLQRLWQRQ